MRARGWLKLVLVTVGQSNADRRLCVCRATGQPGLTVLHTLIFSCVTGALTGYWLRADARRAWRDALDQGYVSTRHASDDVLKIADDCPNRWLVVLYIELNPDLAGPL